ncbi:MAG: HPr family phosphocarrier protein [Caldicoprobacterales bacterium]|jgi:phosphocarrier protein HPr|nr:HPr family phosphocarrier protein [Clostridiales bacterium]
MLEKEFVINDETGLHARPAAKFTKVANSFKSEIRVIKGDKTGNGKSLLSILALGIFGGTKFTVKIVGPDEVEAMYSITRLIERNFKED